MFSIGANLPVSGTVYGVALNSTAERAALAETFRQPPYKVPPAAPVLYIKPRNTYLAAGGVVQMPPGQPVLEARAALAAVLARDLAHASIAEAEAAIAGYTLALDIAEPGADYFRPPIRAKCQDGFLPLGPELRPLPRLPALTLAVDGAVRATALPDALELPPAELVARISSFMTFRAGDAILFMLTPPATAGAGARISAQAAGFAPLTASLAGAQPS